MKYFSRIINPFWIFAWIFSFSLFLYSFKFSRFYPDITFSVGFFFFVIILGSGLIAFFLGRFQVVDLDFRVIPPLKHEISFLLVLWFASFVYNRGLPVIQVMRGDLSYDIYGFGLPFIHVALLTYTSVFSLRAFSAFLISRKVRYFLEFSFFPFIAFLIYSRSAMSIFFGAAFVIYLSFRKIDRKRIAAGIIFLVAAFFAFGYLGDQRLRFQVEQVGSRADDFDNLMELFASPSPGFYDSGIPLSFMWGYLYASSPIGNFQNIVDSSTGDGRFGDFFLTQLVPDIIAKRLPLDVEDEFDREPFLITPSLTVGTTFFAPYYYYGWFGVYIVWILILSLWFFFYSITRGAYWRLLFSAVFSSFLIFSLFDNMVRYSACLLQIFIPPLLSHLIKSDDVV